MVDILDGLMAIIELTTNREGVTMENNEQTITRLRHLDEAIAICDRILEKLDDLQNSDGPSVAAD